LVNGKVFIAKLFGVMVAALLLAGSFPLPAYLSGMESPAAVWTGLVTLIIVIRTSRPKAAFWWSFLCGLLYNSVMLLWLLQLRHSWGYLPVVILSWLGLSSYCALYTGLFGLLLASVFPDQPEDYSVDVDIDSPEQGAAVQVLKRLAVLLAAPLLWTGLEYLRAVVGTGFPWNQLGVSQYRSIAAIQVAAVGGVYAVSALIVLLNTAVALTGLRITREVVCRKKRSRFHYELMVALTAVAVCWLWGVSRVKRGDRAYAGLGSLRTACVQPAVPQLKKWTPAFVDETYHDLKEQSRLAVSVAPELMVWPETAAPDILTVDPVAQRIVYSIVTNGCYLLVGSMDYEKSDEGRIDYYNSSFLVNSNGRIIKIRTIFS